MATDGRVEIMTLASGSSGNALYLRMGTARILVDAGISRQRIVQGLATVGVRPDQLSAILLTHEHKDHVRAVPLLCRKEPNVPVFATKGTWRSCVEDLSVQSSPQPVEPGVSFSLSEVRVTPFRVDHDAREPVGYRFDVPGFSVGLVTDLGVAKEVVRTAAADCDVLLLESNYDVEMLRWGKYPGWLKGRVASERGHLSNHQAKLVLQQVLGPHLQHVILIHLSEENNRPELALEAARLALEAEPTVKLTVAPRHEPGPLLTFRPEGELRTVTLDPSPRQGQLPFR